MGPSGEGDKAAGSSGRSWPTPRIEDDHPLPFVLRVGHRWVDVRDAPGPGDKVPLMFRRRAALTGALAFTQKGQDVQFTDIGVAPQS